MKTILVDKNQHAGKHDVKHAYLRSQGYQLKEMRLYDKPDKDADYMFEGGHVVIDTKANIQELAQCLKGNMKRFRAECRRTHEKGLRLVILTETEHIADVMHIEDLERWHEPDDEYQRRRRGYIASMRRAGKKPVVFLPMRIQGKFAREIVKTATTMMSETDRYSISFEFCHPLNAGARIVEILESEEQ